MRFASPAALLLLLLIPVVAVVGWPGRGFNRPREALSLGLRLLILLCLVLSLAGLEVGRRSDRLAVVFLLDASDSMPEPAQASALEYIRRALGEMEADDQAALVVFGEDALVERPMSSNRELGSLSSVPATGGTDLSEAIRLGLALYPPDAARRMVILSDGQVTEGDHPAAARLAAASGVQVMAVPFLVEPGPEVMITSVEAPTHLRQGERFELQATTQAVQETGARVRVLSNGQLIHETDQRILPGVHTFSLPLEAGEPGFYRYQVQIEPGQDGFYQNNQFSAYVEVEGPPKVLLVSSAGQENGQTEAGDLGEAAQLFEALQAANLEVDRLRPVELPTDLAELAQYDSLVLVNLPARELSQRQMRAIQSYTRDLGGGLVAVGGPTSYGVGGYYHTPLEETLPVEMQIKDEQRRPSVAIVFIIDHSGSMSEVSGGAVKLELAKEAAIRSIELLFPNDRVGVIAFDETASWVAPLTDLSNPSAVKNAIGSIRAGGGTDILAGVQAMARVLPQDPARVKHVILLTDGGADPTGIPELVERLHEESEITLTAIGVGQDAASFLPDLARIGGGRFHFTADPSAIPSIFTEETSLATRSYIVERTFTPQAAASSPILAGIDSTPPLHGYVGTTAKAAARTILVSDLGDPLLAAWQYGLGRAVAFTSDATHRWSQDWTGWEGFPSFWAQAVGYTIGDENQNAALEVRVDLAAEGDPGGPAKLLVDARSEDGSLLNHYAFSARLIAPSGEVESHDLQQIAPGRYEAGFQPAESGAYLISVSGASTLNAENTGNQSGSAQGSPSGQPIAETAGWVLPYAREYGLLQSDPGALAAVASLTGGDLASPDPADIFAHNLPAPLATRPAWPWLLSLAALLLPFDIAVRRLVISRSELGRAWARVTRAASRTAGTAQPSLQRPARIENLLRAKQRTRPGQEQKGSEEPHPVETAAVYEQSRGTEEAEGLAGPQQERPSPPVPEETAAEPPGTSTAASLLAHKRRKRKDRS